MRLSQNEFSRILSKLNDNARVLAGRDKEGIINRSIQVWSSR